MFPGAVSFFNYAMVRLIFIHGMAMVRIIGRWEKYFGESEGVVKLLTEFS